MPQSTSALPAFGWGCLLACGCCCSQSQAPSAILNLAHYVTMSQGVLCLCDAVPGLQLLPIAKVGAALLTKACFGTSAFFHRLELGKKSAPLPYRPMLLWHLGIPSHFLTCALRQQTQHNEQLTPKFVFGDKCHSCAQLSLVFMYLAESSLIVNTCSLSLQITLNVENLFLYCAGPYVSDFSFFFFRKVCKECKRVPGPFLTYVIHTLPSPL